MKKERLGSRTLGKEQTGKEILRNGKGMKWDGKERKFRGKREVKKG